MKGPHEQHVGRRPHQLPLACKWVGQNDPVALLLKSCDCFDSKPDLTHESIAYAALIYGYCKSLFIRVLLA